LFKLNSITFTGNTRSGWYNPGSVSTLSHLYEKKWWQALFQNNHYLVGATLSSSLNSFYPTDKTYKYIYKELNLLGDPGLHLWTLNPTTMTVTHDSTILPGSQNFTVNVKSGLNLEGALVCVMQDPDVYAYGTTNSSGNAVLSIAPAGGGSMTVTVTAQNKKYYQGSVTVSGGGDAPTLNGISPKCGPEAGGTPVMVMGTNFSSSPPTTVRIDGVDCTNQFVITTTLITCNTPSGVNGWKTVEVSNANGSDSLVGFEGFRYFPIPNFPFNCTTSNTYSLDTPADVNLVISGNPATLFLLYYSLGGGPLPSPYGVAGLDMPIYPLFMSQISGQGYTFMLLPIPAGYGPLTFYMQVLGLDSTGQPLWAIGGGNPNGTGSIEFNLNN